MRFQSALLLLAMLGSAGCTSSSDDVQATEAPSTAEPTTEPAVGSTPEGASPAPASPAEVPPIRTLFFNFTWVAKFQGNLAQGDEVAFRVQGEAAAPVEYFVEWKATATTSDPRFSIEIRDDRGLTAIHNFTGPSPQRGIVELVPGQEYVVRQTIPEPGAAADVKFYYEITGHV